MSRTDHYPFCWGCGLGTGGLEFEWRLTGDSLEADHVVLEMARRPELELEMLREVKTELGLGIGVIDIKDNEVEEPKDVAASIERAVKILGPDRVKWVHPDCGFWMLKRNIADGKIRALVKGRDLYEGR